MAGLATAFGSGAMTNSINELEDVDVVIVSGSNTTEAHPQIARRILAAVDRGAKLIVIDPRRTALAQEAHVHLALRPGTDIALLNGMMRIILDEGLADDHFIEMRTENFIALRDQLFKIDLDEIAAITGVDRQLMHTAACLYARAYKSTFCYCLGITQHICGTNNVQTIANMAMLTGNVEKENAGVDPLRGQNNVQGACDMAALPACLPGYQSLADMQIRQKFKQCWGVDVPLTPGRTVLDMTHSGHNGTLRGMFVMGENPILSDPDQTKVQATLEGLDFLAVSDIFLTETAQLAHVVFPAASFAEKSGTVTNSERRVQYMHQVIEPIGECKPDSTIIAELAERMGYEMYYESMAEVMEEIALLIPIYGGMHHDRLRSSWGLQWPCPNRDHPGTPFLHKHYFSGGKGHFTPAQHQEPFEPPGDAFPLTLITGRIYHHYHTGTMTRRCASLNRESDKALLQINPVDATTSAIRNGDLVELTSRRGTIRLWAQISEDIRPGQVYTTFHFSEAPVNLLTTGAADPIAKCPEFKVCAVKVARVES